MIFMDLGKGLGAIFDNLEKKNAMTLHKGMQWRPLSKMTLGNTSMLAKLAFCCQTFKRRSLEKCAAKGKHSR